MSSSRAKIERPRSVRGTFHSFLPKYRFGAVMLWNCESGLPAGLMPMLFDRYLGLPEVNWAGIDHDDVGDLSGGGGSGND